MNLFLRARGTRIATASLVAACVAGCSSSSTLEFTVEQAPPVLTRVQLGDQGPSHGDLLAFESTISRDGEVVGELTGMLTTVDLAVPAGTGREALEERFGTLVFRFGDTDTIVANGSSVYPVGEAEMAEETPQVRAVLGGTGSYLGVTGQVTTTRQGGGAYRHRLELIKPD